MKRIWLAAFLLSLPSVIVTWPLSNLPSLGLLCGLVGLTLFCFNLILGSRFPGIEKLFGPLNLIYKTHHLLGLTATLVLLAHPLLLSGGDLTFLLPSLATPTKNLGILALLFLLVLIALSLRRRLPYELWRFTHKFMGVVLFIGAVHGLLFMAASLKVYFILLCLVTFTLYFYHTVFGRWLVKRYAYTVSSVTVRGAVTELTFTPQSQPLPTYLPGQFAFFTLLGQTHPFSLTSNLSISAKNLGDFTSQLPSVKVGTPVLVEGPYGRFSYLATPHKNQIWIAGGIGITPFLGMARHLVDPSYHITLFYCTTDPSEAIYLNELQSHPIIKTISHCSATQGRITADLIAQSPNPLNDYAIFICGPVPFMKSLRQQFNALGVPHSRIYTEEFALD